MNPGTTAKTVSEATNKDTGKSTASTTDVTTNEFLKLLVTQMQNQDPMDPMDNSQFLTQLASFSSMEQLISINQGVSTIADAYGENSDSSKPDASE
jgi:flagellar basal-body rod modification protein FlgD